MTIEHERDDTESVATSDTWAPGMYTPGSPTVADSVVGGPPATIDVSPWPGKTYIIVDDQNRAITLLNGNLRAEKTHYEGHNGSSRWYCVEKNGWLGFRNTVSGTYL
ncbi:hypothetical protein F5884DRAFT_802450 [Xylogone sp. PMI_703]|nr:hypothetical protein F5884DRAFT_802450 [Xylogone sp. PMI_703]